MVCSARVRIAVLAVCQGVSTVPDNQARAVIAGEK